MIQIVPPKTVSSVRMLPLPDVLLQVVLRHRELQEQEREAYGPDWNRQDLVFPSTNGMPSRQTRPHDLRHSCATLLTD